jgi:hypothetical protein
MKAKSLQRLQPLRYLFDYSTRRKRPGGEMKFAKIVFRIAGIWGLLTLTPLYFIFDMIGRKDPPPITHPAFFYGFVGAALAWQIAFFIIATDPARYRLLMIPSVLEKFSYGIAVVLLVMQHRMRASDLMFGGIDLLLGLLFVIAYLKTPRRESPRTT